MTEPGLSRVHDIIEGHDGYLKMKTRESEFAQFIVDITLI